MSSQLRDDICEQEDSIFKELGYQESRVDEAEYQLDHNSIRFKARKQLAISPDSPFSHLQAAIDHQELDKLKIERTSALREETDGIKRQLEFVKSRLEELKNHQNQVKSVKQIGKSKLNPPYRIDEAANARQRSPNRSEKIRPNEPSYEAKLRPLTGQADCPNCTCDRRHSVCNQCINLALIKPELKKRSSLTVTVPKKVVTDDERPIRPAKDRTLATVEVPTVDDIVVPGRVYTISKSLNEKRTKLAQAIDDLQLMMDQVKERENKLTRERKVVQMYKNQWKYGPTIGGPKASSREQLGATQRRHYQSRMDPNLSRDIRSVMGFQHIEPALKLRQYDSPKQTTRAQTFRPSIHARSKSLESLQHLHRVSTLSNSNKTIDTFKNSKSSSEVNLNVDIGVEEQIEDEMKIDDSIDQSVTTDTNEDKEEIVQQLPNEASTAPDVEELNSSEHGSINGTEKSQKMAWIPVFGETEVKTVKRAPTKRKIQIVTPDESPTATQIRNRSARMGSQLKSSLKKDSNTKATGNNIPKPSDTKMVNKSQGNSVVMVEAERRLKIASNLLEQEQRDSATKNQLVISKPKPLPRQRTFSKTNSAISNSEIEKQDNRIDLNPMKEISRLEEMVREQQQLVAKLTQNQEDNPQTSRPFNSQACCHHSSPCQHSSTDRYCSSPTTGSRRLINSLRDRLNRTKTRLARTLEEEREKHQLLQMKVDSSLRKQSDLENENELLKKSLSKCIDTCLKDISSTFESLSDTLDDSILSLNKQQNQDDDNISTSSGSILTNAAQLITDNRHLKQMQSHIQTIEKQRKGIFEELNKEKQKSQQLESQLKDSQSELDQLSEIKRKLESQLTLATREKPCEGSELSNIRANHEDDKQGNKAQDLDKQLPTTSSRVSLDMDDQKESDKSDLDDSFTCVDLYRRYIQSISPDIESLRRERKSILSEFDNIKKMLSDIDN